MLCDIMPLPTSITKIGLALNFLFDTHQLWYHNKKKFKQKKLLIF
jgi:hypothetical protein